MKEIFLKLVFSKSNICIFTYFQRNYMRKKNNNRELNLKYVHMRLDVYTNYGK